MRMKTVKFSEQDRRLLEWSLQTASSVGVWNDAWCTVDNGFFGQVALNYLITHYTVCWKDFMLLTTTSISGIKVSLISQNVYKLIQSAGNQRQLSSLVGSSETTRITSSDKRFSEWLGGLIDGAGCLVINKAGYTSCEITIGASDLRCLKIIQNKLGGSIKARSGANVLRWRLHNKAGIINLVNCIQNHIHNPARIKQLHKVCLNLGINTTLPTALTKDSAWFIGFFDADGTITLNCTTPQITISACNKQLVNVSHFKDHFSGDIHFDQALNGHYKWSIQTQNDIDNFLSYSK